MKRLKTHDKILFATLCGMLTIHLISLIYNIVIFRTGEIQKDVFDARLIYFFAGILAMFGIFLAEQIFRIRFPFFLELTVMIYAFTASTLAYEFGLYTLIIGWDKLVHTFAGVVFALIGLCLAHFLFDAPKEGLRMALAFAIVGLALALAEGYLWEIFEFTADTLTGGDLQPWNDSFLQDLGNGTYLVSDPRGAGLIDSMLDLVVNLIGGLAVAIPAFFLLWKRPSLYPYIRCERIKRKR